MLMYTRKTLAGEFIVVNKKLVEMEKNGLWSEDKKAIINEDPSRASISSQSKSRSSSKPSGT
jgi:hypothetical protein